MCSRTEMEDGWRAQYGNDSRSWLISGKEETTSKPVSTMREHFLPKENLKKPIGPRRELLEKFLLKEVANNLKKDLTEDLEDDERVTEYGHKFSCDGFDPTKAEERTEKDYENYLKYPLYYDAGRTVWTDRLGTLDGKTQSAPNAPLAVFRKNSSFTKPITQVYDMPKPGSIGFL